MWIVAIVLGIVEGLTEFLPVSSTGHLIVAGHLLGFRGPRAEAFEVIIQFGAILAVVWERRAYLWRTLAGGPRSAAARGLTLNLTLGFLPAAVIGLLFHDAIKRRLFAPGPVAIALLVGGVAILAVERYLRPGATVDVGSVGPRQALAVGCAQVLSLWPGTSRSAATILGGMACGMSRPVATEFSFLLAIPVMAAATGFDLVKGWSHFSGSDLGFLVLSFAISFVVALATVKGLLRYVRNHGFAPFGVYRILFAILIFVWRPGF